MTANIPGFDLPSIIVAILRVLIVLSEKGAISSNRQRLIAGAMKTPVPIAYGRGEL